MPAGATVNVGECRGEWCQVEFRGQRGFANSALLSGGDAALAAAPVATPAAASTKYDANDEVRVLNWHDTGARWICASAAKSYFPPNTRLKIVSTCLK